MSALNLILAKRSTSRRTGRHTSKGGYFHYTMKKVKVQKEKK